MTLTATTETDRSRKDGAECVTGAALQQRKSRNKSERKQDLQLRPAVNAARTTRTVISDSHHNWKDHKFLDKC